EGTRDGHARDIGAPGHHLRRCASAHRLAILYQPNTPYPLSESVFIFHPSLSRLAAARRLECSRTPTVLSRQPPITSLTESENVFILPPISPKETNTATGKSGTSNGRSFAMSNR